MVITVASGKGGTGKTTIATNLAWVLSQTSTANNNGSTWLIDCDVEEPNAALFIHPAFEKEKKVTRWLPTIDQDRCTGCGI